jgi:hypothetical protein
MNRLTTLLRSLFARPARPAARPAVRRSKIGVESLEDRFMPSTVFLGYGAGSHGSTGGYIVITGFNVGVNGRI